MHDVTGWAAAEPGAPLRPWTFPRRDPGERDVAVRVTHCGLCATDLHSVRHGDPAVFPLVPGHEMVGEVTGIGSSVTHHRVGDPVAIGNIVDSCRVCASCRGGHENMCERIPTLTYGGSDRHTGGVTQGGFSREMVVDEDFVYAAPAGLDPASVAPLLCAGITTWSPLRRFGVGSGTTVGVVGVGGLGHLAVKFAHALGAETVAFTSSPAKGDAARALGADDVVLTRDEQQMAAQSGRFDLVMDTTGAPLDLNPYLATLGLRGTLVLAGIPSQALRIDPMSLVMGERSIVGTGSGGIPDTRSMLDFCAARGIAAEVETVTPAGLDDAMGRLARGDVRFRFSVDMTAA